MSASTRILIRLIRFRVLICMAAMLGMCYLIGTDDNPSPNGIVFLLLEMSILLTLFAGFHKELSSTMFPVSNRQAAWIPMAAAATLIVAGIIGIQAGQLLSLEDLRPASDKMSVWIPVLKIFPAFLFIGLLAWRIVRMGSQYMVWVVILPMLAGDNQFIKEHTPAVLELCYICWPLGLVGSAFLIYEAPFHAGVVRRMDSKKTGFGDFVARTAQEGSPTQAPAITRAADALSWAVLLVMGVSVLLVIWPGVVAAFSGESDDNTILLVLLCLAFIVAGSVRDLWKRNRANGMSRERSFKILLVEMTGIGYAFREYMGVKPGAVVTCGRCRGWKLAWFPECPHCGGENSGQIKTLYEPNLLKLGAPWEHDRGAFIFRRMVPALLAFWAFMQLVG